MLTRRCLAIIKRRIFLSTRRRYSTKQSDDDSIFSPTQSPWDHVFKDIDGSPKTPTHNQSRLAFSPRHMYLPNTTTKRRRQTMTANEIRKFEEMFRMIFDSVTENRPSSEFPADDIEIHPTNKFNSKIQLDMNDLFGTLRRQSKNIKWTATSDEDLDRKKEEMDLCGTDQQLLEWAMREVFGESQKYEEAARKAIEKVANSENIETMPMLQHPAYPYLIALLMRTFREKYRDPHLSLSIFNYARHLSIPSYVFGCTAPSYNELIETRWTCFRDLPGILEALEEMKVNGVQPETRTRKLVEIIRREAGQSPLWEHDDPGGNRVMDLLNKIDLMVARRKPQLPAPIPNKILRPEHPRGSWNSWKATPEDDQWEFGNWDYRRF